MASRRATLGSSCGNCGGNWVDYWQIIDSIERPELTRSPDLFTALCHSCASVTTHTMPQLVLYWARQEVPVVIAPSAVRDDEQREAQLSSALLMLGANGDYDEEHFDPEMLIVSRSSWHELTASDSDLIREHSLWPTLPAQLRHELSIHELRLAGRAWLLEVPQHLTFNDFERSVRAIGPLLTMPPAQAAIRTWLSDHSLAWGGGLPNFLGALLDDMSHGVQLQTAWAKFRTALEGGYFTPPNAGLRAMLLTKLPAAQRARVSHILLQMLEASKASEALRSQYWRERSLLEFNLMVSGDHQRAAVSRALDKWVGSAQLGEDKNDLAEALARRAAFTIMIEDSNPPTSVEAAIKDLRESFVIVPPNILDTSHQVRLGNLAQALAQRANLETPPDFSEAWQILSELLSAQGRGENRAYNLVRRASLILQSQRNPMPYGSVRAAVLDLREALLFAEKEGMPEHVRAEIYLNLLMAHVGEVVEKDGKNCPAAVAEAWSTLGIIEHTESTPQVQTAALEQAAILARALGDPAQEQGYLRRAFERSGDSGYSTRHRLSYRLGTSFIESSRFLDAGAWLAIAFALEESAGFSRSLVQLAARPGEGPTRAGRWASYAFAKAGQAELAVVLLEASLTSKYAARARLALIDRGHLARLDPALAHAFAEAVAAQMTSQDASKLLATVRRLAPSTARVDFDAIAALATDERPVVYVNPTPHGTVVLIIGGGGHMRTLEVDVSGADFSRWVAGTAGAERPDPRALVFQGTTGGIRAALDWSLPILGSRLSSALAEALREGGAQAILLVEAGFAPFLPIHAAPYAGDGGYSGQERLADWLEIVRLPSISLVSRAVGKAPLDGFIGIGDSDAPNMSRLPWAAKEVATIGNLFASERRFVVTGSDATLRNLVEEYDGHSVIHLALHVKEIGGGLHFSFADTLLPVMELASQLRTSPKLVVASGCSSSRSDLTANLDEAPSLQADLIASGCDAVIGALWPVNDLATAILMSRFYENLMTRTCSPSSALFEAAGYLRSLHRDDVKAWTRAADADSVDRGALGAILKRAEGWFAKRTYPFAHPVYWAGFVVYDRTVEGASE